MLAIFIVLMATDLCVSQPLNLVWRGKLGQISSKVLVERRVVGCLLGGGGGGGVELWRVGRAGGTRGGKGQGETVSLGRRQELVLTCLINVTQHPVCFFFVRASRGVASPVDREARLDQARPHPGEHFTRVRRLRSDATLNAA